MSCYTTGSGLKGVSSRRSRGPQHLQAPSSIQCGLGLVSEGPHAPETPRDISLFRVMINLTVATSGSFQGISVCMHFSLIFLSLLVLEL